jgi:hypothetical protein
VSCETITSRPVQIDRAASSGIVSRTSWGEESRIRIDPADGGGQLTILDYRAPASFGPPRHLHHREDEVIELMRAKQSFGRLIDQLRLFGDEKCARSRHPRAGRRTRSAPHPRQRDRAGRRRQVSFEVNGLAASLCRPRNREGSQRRGEIIPCSNFPQTSNKKGLAFVREQSGTATVPGTRRASGHRRGGGCDGGGKRRRTNATEDPDGKPYRYRPVGPFRKRRSQIVKTPPRHARELIQPSFGSTEFLEGPGFEQREDT